MNVASLELCKELYELSGWGTTERHWWPDRWTSSGFPVVGVRPVDIDHKIDTDLIPAYDLDYLLDKLVEVRTGLTLYHVHSTMQWECFYAGKFFEYGTDTQHWETQDSNPANAVCKLAIELFKTGILTK